MSQAIDNLNQAVALLNQSVDVATVTVAGLRADLAASGNDADVQAAADAVLAARAKIDALTPPPVDPNA